MEYLKGFIEGFMYKYFTDSYYYNDYLIKVQAIEGGYIFYFSENRFYYISTTEEYESIGVASLSDAIWDNFTAPLIKFSDKDIEILKQKLSKVDFDIITYKEDAK